MGHFHTQNLKIMPRTTVSAFLFVLALFSCFLFNFHFVRHLLEVLITNSLLDCISGEKHSRPKPLNIEEEQSMRVFYENKLREVCSAFYFPNKIQVRFSLSRILWSWKNFSKRKNENSYWFYLHSSGICSFLQATALLYFKRFYLQWSVMDHHPKNIMYDSYKSLLITYPKVYKCSCDIRYEFWRVV